MKKIIKLVAILGMAIVLSSCATNKNRKEHLKLQKFVKTGQYDQALIVAKGKDFYADKDSLLLK